MTGLMLVSADDLREIVKQVVVEIMGATGAIERTTGGMMSRKQAAAYLGISVSTLDRQDIPFRRIGSRIMYAVRELDGYGRTDRAQRLNDKLRELAK